jgi:Tol biopolymer transport system component
VFSSDRYDDNMEVVIMREDGTSQTRLTDNEVSDCRPSLCASGTKIVFDRGTGSFCNPVGGPTDILKMNPDGSSVSNLSAVEHDPYGDYNDYGGDCGSPVATGSPVSIKYRVLFTSNKDGDDDIYVMFLDGTGVQKLTDGEFVDYHPAWCGDGYVVYALQTPREIYAFQIARYRRVAARRRATWPTARMITTRAVIRMGRRSSGLAK